MSNNLKCTLSLFALLLFFQLQNVQAQSYAEPKLSEKVLTDTSYQLIVVVQKPVKVNELRPFKKNPGMDKLYHDALDTLNANWVAAVQAHWKLHKNPKFMSVDELLKFREPLSKPERAKILVLAYGSVEDRLRSTLEERAAKKQPMVLDKYIIHPWLRAYTSVGLYNLEALNKIMASGDGTYYESLSESWQKCVIPTVCACYYIGNWYPGYADLAFALTNIQELMQRRAEDKKFKDTNVANGVRKPKLLENKTLLIPVAYTQGYHVNELLIDVTEADIRANYPYPFKIVKQDEIDRVFRAQDSQYAILFRSLWPGVPGTGYSEAHYWAVDAADGHSIISFTEQRSPIAKGRNTYSLRYSFFDKRARELAGQETGKK